MTITTIVLPDGFGNYGPRDAEFVRSIFTYHDGILRWAVKPAWQVEIGCEAGSVTPKGYRRVRLGFKTFRSHRIVWLMHHDKWPECEIDHINGNRSDNRIENLRDVSCYENQKNKKRSSRNKSGVAGVYWLEKERAWRAYISLDKKLKHLGHFRVFDDAVAARKAAEAQNGYHQNHGR